ncbi:hypothetical protein ACQKP8_26985 [Photobacterium alginatilyticum]|uniref:hypothetical protein n=1 Tax=Photobacterium alginatilyticum TaxID=1775171 RepID=UPI004069081B
MMMELLRFIGVMSILMPCFTVAGDDFYFRHLNDKVTEYSKKIVTCDNKKVTPKLSKSETNVLKRIISERPLILAYLSTSSFNKCLQPERGELAEVLLSYQYLELPSYTVKLAKSTEKLTFTTDFDNLKSYESLSNNDKKTIDSIVVLQQPFNELEVFEHIMGM